MLNSSKAIQATDIPVKVIKSNLLKNSLLKKQKVIFLQNKNALISINLNENLNLKEDF